MNTSLGVSVLDIPLFSSSSYLIVFVFVFSLFFSHQQGREPTTTRSTITKPVVFTMVHCDYFLAFLPETAFATLMPSMLTFVSRPRHSPMTPQPTVILPSRMANLRPFSRGMG